MQISFWTRLTQAFAVFGMLLNYLGFAEIVGQDGPPFEPLSLKNIGGRDFEIRGAADGSGKLVARRTR